MALTFSQTELHKLNEKQKQAFVKFKHIIHDAYYFKELRQSEQQIYDSISLEPTKSSFKRMFLVRDEDRVVGYAFFLYNIMEQDTNKEFCEMYIEVDPHYSRQGIGVKLLSMLIKLAEENSKTKVEIWSNDYALDGKITETILKTGLKHATEEKMNRLERNNVNMDLIENRLPSLEVQLKEYRLERYDREEYFNRILQDEEFCKEVADFHNETMNMIPKENSEHNDIVFTPQDIINRSEAALKMPYNGCHFILWDGKTTIGYSATFYPKSDVRGVNTGFTGVRKDYQRKGIAMYLKLNIVKYYLDKDDFLQIDTENAQSNAGMIKINESIGFRHIFSWMSFEGKVEDLKEYVSKKKLSIPF